MTDTRNALGPTPYSVVMLTDGRTSTPVKAPWTLAGEAQHFANHGAHLKAEILKRWSHIGSRPMCVVNVYPKPVPTPYYTDQNGHVRRGHDPDAMVNAPIERTDAFAPVPLKPGEVHCGTCRGSGYWARGMEDIECHVCKGSGVDPATRIPDFGLFGSNVPPEN